MKIYTVVTFKWEEMLDFGCKVWRA